MNVLCPVDFSKASRAALRHAVEAVRREGGSLTVLFVNDPLLTAAGAAAYDTRSLERTTHTALAAFVRKALAAAPRMRRPTLATALGRPAREIVKAAQHGSADLIVMGTHGLSGVNRLMLGSVTNEVLKTAPVPVLVVPPGAAGARRRRPGSR